MNQCWDADPLKRPDAYTLWEKINAINLYHQKKSNEPTQLEINKNFEINKTSSFKTNYTSSILSASKVHQFGFFSEPKNATEEEKEAYYSKSYDVFQIPDNIIVKKLKWIIKLKQCNNRLRISILKTKMEYLIIQIFIQKNKMNRKFLIVF
ncbi:hypothetical protein GLOIN_2v1504954, partial [Rhizophagus irregularis DAOM 181602=DAOM 197198]